MVLTILKRIMILIFVELFRLLSRRLYDRVSYLNTNCFRTIYINRFKLLSGYSNRFDLVIETVAVYELCVWFF